MPSAPAHPRLPPGYAEGYSGGRLRDTAIAFIVLEVGFVTLRYVSRALGKLPLGVNDYLMIPALVVWLGSVECPVSSSRMTRATLLLEG